MLWVAVLTLFALMPSASSLLKRDRGDSGALGRATGSTICYRINPIAYLHSDRASSLPGFGKHHVRITADTDFPSPPIDEDAKYP